MTADAARVALSAWASIVGDDPVITAMPNVTNPVWRIEVCDQPALVLKQLPEYPAGVEPVVEYRVLSHLQGSGVSVALPIVTDTGQIVASIGDLAWSLLPHLPHQTENHELGPDAGETTFLIGAAIGHLSQALADYPYGVASFVDDPVKVLDEALPQLPDEVIRLARPYAGRLVEVCGGLPIQLTHGDCNDGNVLINSKGRVSFIDIDHLPVGPRVRDLAYYLTSRLRRHLGSPQTAMLTTCALITAVPSYVAGYRRVQQLSEQEIAAIVPLMLVAEIGGAHWSLYGWEPNLANYRRSKASIEWLIARLDELTVSIQARQ
ncbi:phosphotransferase enzyme family protein [Microlunatus phosphovorus]|uniref:phosphotransferase enzyme family protein n=1 Tax=Microlunatus phosphovorus TaxID=29405 RepID=UPI0012EACEA2|nr:phosphotransferase [Microlunatus phosphovorus]